MGDKLNKLTVGVALLVAIVVVCLAVNIDFVWSKIAKLATIIPIPFALGLTAFTSSKDALAMDGFFNVLAKIHEILSNPDRLKMLNALSVRPRSYTELKSLINANPRTNSWHISMLGQYGLIMKNDNGYEITDLGKLAIENGINGMVQIVQQVIQAYDFNRAQ